MKIIVLADHRIQNQHLENEHGLCIYVETDGYKCLLDTGASDLFIRNAEKLSVELKEVDFVFISHGHSDHIGGLPAFLKMNTQAKVVLSKNALQQKFYSQRNGWRDLSLKDDITEFHDRLVFVENEMVFGNEIHVVNVRLNKYPFPKANKLLYKNDGKLMQPDDFNHELVVSFGKNDLLVYTGCAHNGLLNVLETVDLMNRGRVKKVIGGFHLPDGKTETELETNDEMKFICDKIITQYPQTHFSTGHCTGDSAYRQLKIHLNDRINQFYTGYFEEFDL